jgi:hypothetical protein
MGLARDKGRLFLWDYREEYEEALEGEERGKADSGGIG